ncbi:helicase and polymerase-containing protein TEBICHI [Silene latifolia]|uniref:helicase and polymerase-containing protein TEBICHI n=1 Tax=Silene latifolia TaxID=37657 RepID=UPI003D777DDC
MDSSPPRARIDQFFTSKKRRALSPKTVKESSPSAKGSLDSFLVTSQNDGSSIGQGGVRRNLSLDIDVSANNEVNQPILSKQEISRDLGSSGVVPGVRIEAESDGVGADRIDDSDPPLDPRKAEIKRFAMDFTSLFCSSLRSDSTKEQKPNEHKRQGSPSGLVSEEIRATKRHCTGDQQNSQPEPQTPNCDKRTSFIAPCSSVAEKTEKIATSSKELGSLRKCSIIANSNALAVDCCTPAPLRRNSIPRETPISTRGNSIFSPGEEFWNEAIQVADGLFAQKDKNDVQADEVAGIGTIPDGGSSHNFSKGSSKEDVKALNHSSQDKEASPFPVKHFDFSCEAKNLEARCFSVNIDDCKTGSENSKCIFADERVVTRSAVLPAVEVSVHTTTDHTKLISNSLDRVYSNSVPSSSPHGAGTPSSSMPLEDRLDLSNWLPPSICNIYKRRGIAKLYPWQVDCLQVDGVLQKRNLVYCASTSAGKSFVAEILMLRRVIESGKMALLVLPYVSICVEKAEHLDGLLEPLGKHVRSYYGNQGGGTLPKDTSVAVCTIEKANSLVNRLLEEDRLSEVGIIVIDELHMVADPNRGYLLELLLTKLRYAAGEGNGDTSSGDSSSTSSGKSDVARGLQIVGMSATMPNVAAVADWLHAALYQTEFRPVPLEEYVKVGNSIYDKKMEVIRTIPKSADLGGKDPDHVVQLCNEIVQDGHSVLIFCSSRKGCESTARHISMYLKKFSAKIQDEQSEFTDVSSAIDALRRCPAGLDPVLEQTLPSGVAYHHAGLTVEEREIIETCYRKGLVRILTATSTLAAGVNLPARRVIFRQPKIGRDFLDGTRYRQMAGRAGRTGIDEKGESVLICKPEEVKRIKALLNDCCPPLQSCLSEDKNGMTHAILEVVASGIVQTANDIHRYVRCTLLNSTKPFEDVVKSAQDSLKWLCHRKFLEWNDDTKLYSTTPLGRASFGSSLSPEESLIVLDDLSRAREGFVLASDLHLVYLATPINVEVEPDWELFYERFMELPSIDQSVGNRVGVVEPFLMRMAHGAPVRAANRLRNDLKGLHSRIDSQLGVSRSSTLSDDQSLRVCRRFYVALILSRLVQELPVGQVCEAFKVARGLVQALQENAGRFASMVSVFCERLGWHDLEGLVAKFQNRVSFGVRAEIVELTTIPYVKGSRARALYKSGLRTPLAIAEASVNEIVKALFESSSWTTQDLAQRRVQLGIAKKIKNGARKIVLDKAEEARAAAFSAFQSLGMNVPDLSLPFLSPTTSGSVREKESPPSLRENDVRISTHVSPAKLISAELPKKQDDARLLDAYAERPDKNAASSLGTLSKRQAEKGLDMGMGSSTMGKGENVLPGVEITNKEEQRWEGKNASFANIPNLNEKGPINIACATDLDAFMSLWESVREFYFDLHFNKHSEGNSNVAYEVHGIAICWENSPVYYVNLAKILLLSEKNSNIDSCENESPGKTNSVGANIMLSTVNSRWNRVGKILGSGDVRKFSWNLKVQVQVLRNAVLPIHRVSLSQRLKNAGIELVDGTLYKLPVLIVQEGIDMCIVSWILWPDDERSSIPSLEKEVKKRVSSEAAASANQSGRWKNQMRRAAHNGCCRRVAQTRALHGVLWKLLISEELVEALLSIELPLVHVLADMEVRGIGVDMEGCLKARHLLSKKLKILEKEAFKLAGMTFSMHMPADIANVLFEHLKLPVPEGHDKGKQHISTDKHCLELLRLEHPIVPIIKEHRTLAKLLNCTLGSICSLAKISMKTQKYTVHGHWLQTSTSTGRLSMEEPNLQCVEHMIEFKMYQNNDALCDLDTSHYKINARDFFIPTEENWLLLAADYSQIELRMMAHFSKDSSLIELLSNPQGDVFTMIASRWTGKSENDVSSQERDQTKRLVYGILYGMGPNTLAEQLNCSADEAKAKILSFKTSFPGVASWLQEAVEFCRQRGYVQTLKGRKRFLSKIKIGNSKEKAKAQRQAVNSICQGSAADIIKIAMINMYSVIAGVGAHNTADSLASKFSKLKGRCNILLQVHDELVLEVEPGVIKEAALLLKTCMETAFSLLVPLQAKVKVGKTWGSLELFDVRDSSG